jgi:hypothetical protein
VLIFQIVESSVELNHQVCSVPRAGSAGQVLLRGLQSVKVWAAAEPARAARAAMVKNLVIVEEERYLNVVKERHRYYDPPRILLLKGAITARK